MSEHYGVPLAPRRLSRVRKTFDLVSRDSSLVGAAKFFTMVAGKRLPPAKCSVIAEHVWLLEKTGAPHNFLVFGNDRRVPCASLQRYGDLLVGTEFHFIDEDGNLETLTGPVSANIGSRRPCLSSFPMPMSSKRNFPPGMAHLQVAMNTL